ncbi:hypothetical protein GGR56DRAFT_622437 [Xylariaceae sp. FL0804]|nr:hypothetical protein GGR56DRAFT_622437 [Xylariaceae sp. FL0804]
MATASPSTPPRRGEPTAQPSRIYQAIMTPVNFVSFLVSLYLIDNYYLDQRAGGQKQQQQQLQQPRSWSHWLLFRPQRPQPYSWVQRPAGARSDEKGGGGGDAEGDWHYHSKKRKLLRAEAADAFELRPAVLGAALLLGVALAGALWLLVIALVEGTVGIGRR